MTNDFTINNRILIIEDDADIREGIRIILEGEGYKVDEASNGSEGLALVSQKTDLIILDIMMPGLSGIRTCEMIRKVSNAPVLFLTAKSGESDKVLGLMAGGDDYMTKPFSYSELTSRIKALIRRYRIYKGKHDAEDAGPNYIERSGIRINEKVNEVFVDGKEVAMSRLEYGILLLFMKNPGRIFSAETIYEMVWNDPYIYSSNSTIMVHIRKLRVKIEKDPQDPEHIKTVWGKGYKFE